MSMSEELNEESFNDNNDNNNSIFNYLDDDEDGGYINPSTFNNLNKPIQNMSIRSTLNPSSKPFIPSLYSPPTTYLHHQTFPHNFPSDSSEQIIYYEDYVSYDDEQTFSTTEPTETHEYSPSHAYPQTQTQTTPTLNLSFDSDSISPSDSPPPTIITANDTNEITITTTTTNVTTSTSANTSTNTNINTNTPSTTQKSNSSNNLNNNNNNNNSNTNHPTHTELSSKIIASLQGGTYECMVCFEVIGRRAAVWSCTRCYAIFHLSCMRTWSFKSTTPSQTYGNHTEISLTSNSSTSTGSYNNASLPVNSHKFRCPSCQTSYSETPEYYCFCRKVFEPSYNPYLLPHSCGDLCMKKRDHDCPHSGGRCSMQCHAGPCPPCSSVGEPKTCYCKKEIYQLRCGEKFTGKSCGNVCDAMLNCGVHGCKDICHDSDCKPCDEPVIQRCYCGAHLGERTCGTGELDLSYGDERWFSCENICGKPLNCGNCFCEEECHIGKCKECPLDPRILKTCSCGMNTIQSLLKGEERKSCKDPVPTCKEMCGKLLECEEHLCTARCHNSVCGPCTVKVKVSCRCGVSNQILPCFEANARSPSGPNPIICDNVCRKLLSCKKHQCTLVCCPDHLSTSRDAHLCLIVCGRGLKCGRHKCLDLCHGNNRCKPCLQASFEELRCRCGKTVKYPPISCGTPLPKCEFPCEIVRPCGHSKDGHLCHVGACPPCDTLVEKWCMGGHEIRRNILCHMKETSCGKVCGKLLICGHNCQRYCHSNACDTLPPTSEKGSSSEANKKSNPNIKSCGQICNAITSNCPNHPNCTSVCHYGVPCPIIVCKQKKKITCPCGVNSNLIPCDTPESSPLQKLSCTYICEQTKKTKAMSEVIKVGKSYSEFLVNMARVSPGFLKKLETTFDNFIEYSKVGSNFRLESQDKLQQKMVMDLAAFYGLEASPIPPGFATQLTKTANSKRTLMLLSESVSASSKSKQSPFKKITKPCGLLLYDVRPDLKTQTLVTYLQQFMPDCSIQWIDDTNYFICFENDLVMINAQQVLMGKGLKVKVYKDSFSSSTMIPLR